jgi:D-aminopeptidase
MIQARRYLRETQRATVTVHTLARQDCGLRICDCGINWRVWCQELALPTRIPHSAIRNFLLLACLTSPLVSQSRPRARDLGIVVGVLPAGPLDAITDVSGVRVGQVTIARGDSINTGVTAILPHDGNVFRDKVPAAVVVGNAFGKLAGSTQVNELGELESPIVLTCTLCVPRAADAVLTYLLGLSGNEEVRSANAVVGETNDGYLNDIRARPITEQDVLTAIRSAQPGPVAEGAVGAGRGTIAFGWKGGIGTASRRLPTPLGGWTVGVLVQTNFGGVLTIAGAPVGRELGQYYLKGDLGNGSIMIVVATDAPLDHRQLERLGRRALAGLARTGSSMSNGSGDFVIAFAERRTGGQAVGGAVGRSGGRAVAAAPDVPSARPPVRLIDTVAVVTNEAMSPLFEATIEATEEAIYNSLFKAETVRGLRGTIRALPIDSTVAILKRHAMLRE